MSHILGGLGISGGYQSSSTNQSGSQSNTFSAGQTGLQNALTSLFTSMVPGISGGGLSPDVAAMKTGSADAINKTYTGLGDRMQKFLASRGFAKSGTSGNAQLQTELGRAGAIGNNEASFAGLQLQNNQSLLANALAAAYHSLGQSYTGTSSSSGWGMGMGGGLSGVIKP